MPTGKRTRRAAAALAAVSAVLGAAWMAASPTRVAAADTTPALAGVTTVTTSTSGVATVQLLQAASLSFPRFGPGMEDGPAGTGVKGAGRIVGFVLETGGRPAVAAFAMSDCGDPGCQGQGTFEFVETFTKRGKLNPGTYHLYVVADGAPVTATLALTGVDGATTVNVAPTSGVVEKALAPALPATGVADPADYSAAGDAPIGAAGGLMLSNMTVQTATFEGAYFGSCAAPGAAPPVYATGCDYPPDSGTAEGLTGPFTFCNPDFCDPTFTVAGATQPFEFDGGGEWIVSPGDAGTWSQGGYFQGAAVLTGESATGMWLPFVATPASPSVDQQATPSPPPSPSATPSPTPAGAVQAAVTHLPNTASSDGTAAGGALAATLLGLAAAGGLRRRRRKA